MWTAGALLLASCQLLFNSVCAQTWGERFQVNVTDELPLWQVYKETQQNGYYDLGDGRSLKAHIFELGGCSKGHPCSSSSGLPLLYPDGCPLDKCQARFVGDPWLFSSDICESFILASEAAALETRYGNLTTLSNEWFEFYDTSCMLRYLADSDSWEHRAEGVAIVVRARGFEFPPQTVLVADIDSTEQTTAALWFDFVQEVATNFGLRGDEVVRPKNTYALDYYEIADLWASRPILTPINVTLTRAFLDNMDMTSVGETWVMASIAGLTLQLAEDYPAYQQPEFWFRGAGATVWAEMETSFDTWATSMTLGRKFSQDQAQQVHIMPLQIARRCRCRSQSTPMLVMKPTTTVGLCLGYISEETRFVCTRDGSGDSYCRETAGTGWHATATALPSGQTPCAAHNSSRAVFETAVAGDIAAARAADAAFWAAWPSAGGGGGFAFPSNTPDASVSASPSPTPG